MAKKKNISVGNFPKDKTVAREYAAKATEAGITVKPGVMLYNDFLHACDMLAEEQAGKLFQAISTYQQNGEYTEFSDPTLRFAFSIFIPRAYEDSLKYAEKALRNRYNATFRTIKQDDGSEVTEHPDFNEWFSELLEKHEPIPYSDDSDDQ